MCDVALDHADDAAMVTVKGRIDSKSVADFADAIGVLDAEAVVVVNLLQCSDIDARAGGSLALLNSMRDGRFIIVAAPASRLAVALQKGDGRLQVVSNVHDATVCAKMMAQTAYNTF